HNWWGENTTAEMNEGSNPKNIDEIYDVYDDNGLGFVNYSGWLDEEFEIVIVDPKDKVYLTLTDIDAFIDDTTTTAIELDNLGNRRISGYQFAINYDPSLLKIEVLENQTGISKDFDVYANENTAGKLYIAGIGESGQDITMDGDLLQIMITYRDGGTGVISLSDVIINEGDPEAVVTSTQVSVTDILCGDVTNDFSVSALDAAFILRHTVRLSPQYPLAGRDSTAADVTANGFVSAFDAAMIIKHIVGYPVTLTCRPTNAAKQVVWQPTFDWTPEFSENKNSLRVPIRISDLRTNVSAIEIQLPKNEHITLSTISNLPMGWEHLEHESDQYTTIAMFGLEDLTEETTVMLHFDIEGTVHTSLEAEIRVNEAPKVSLEPIYIEAKPTEFALSQNYPNPFNPSTQIEFSIPEASQVQLEVFNMLGQKVQTLKNERMAAGYYSVVFEAGGLSSGVYFYQLRMGNQVLTKQMLLLK
ncbi:MAG: T9SS type A sorting domain-containing protein, partial [Bacteroidota bacterium]